MSTFPPPLPPPRSSRSRRNGRAVLALLGGAMGAAAVVVVLVISAGAGGSDGDPADRSTSIEPHSSDVVRVDASLLVAGTSCSVVETSRDEFGDIPGGRFQIRDREHEIIGTGRWPDEGGVGFPTGTDGCLFVAASVEVPRRDVYEVGSERRGWRRFNDFEVESGVAGNILRALVHVPDS